MLEYAANIIAKNLYSQVDAEGHHQVMLDDMIDHKKDITAVGPDDRYVTVNERKCHHITTKAGSYVFSGRMALPVGNPWLI